MTWPVAISVTNTSNSYPLARGFLLLFCLLAACAIALPPAHATTVTLLNNDSPGEGLNDNTPATPIGGNTGTSIGEQRQIAFRFAADLIEQIVNSSVEIRIDTNFDSLSCSASSAIIGNAQPATAHSNFTNAPLANTYYVQALANSLAGSDLSATNSDVLMTFNGDIDNNNNCLNNKDWYYGLDGNASGDIDFLSTVLHEMLHGLGFTSLVNHASGAKFSGSNDAYMLSLEDHSIGKTWGIPQMNDAERAISATDDPDLHWVGSNVQSQIGILSAGTDQGHVRMHAPSNLSTGSSVSHFSTALSPNQLMEPILTGPYDSIGLAAELLADIGWSMPASDTPIIGSIEDIDMQNDTPDSITVAIMDNDTDVSSLSVSATSSNTSVIANSGLVAAGSGRLRTLDITPVASATGVVTITVTVTDGSNNDSTQFDVNVVADLPPTVTIVSPAEGALFITSPQPFQASATDLTDGNISSSVSWTSSIDGALGSGASPSFSLTDGSHLITASVTDSGTNMDSDAINVTVSLNGDEDGDGLSNALEQILGTDPFDVDSDDDFMLDFDEVNLDGDPGNYTPGVDADPLNPDTDGDGILDGQDLDPLVFTTEANLPLPGWALLVLALMLGGGFYRQQKRVNT